MKHIDDAFKKLLAAAMRAWNHGGGARRDRTADLLRAKQALSQLSYGPNKVVCIQLWNEFQNCSGWSIVAAKHIAICESRGSADLCNSGGSGKI